MAVDKVRVYITVDTETSMGGAWRNPEYSPLPLERPVFGKLGTEFYGIPLIMDILGQHGFKATFFTEVFCAPVVGRDQVARVFDTILSRGHDPQLHLHPTYRFYRDFLDGKPRRETDLMFQLPAEEQRQLIGEGIGLFKELSGRLPCAFRAGCYGAAESTLAALRDNGITIDSSYNLAYLDYTCGFRVRPLNAPVRIEGVYEFPVTVFRVPGSAGYKPLEISAVSVGEIVSTINCLRTAGCQDVVLVLHSFGLLKNLGTRYENCRPDRIVIQRMRNLCAALSRMGSEVQVMVFGELDLKSVPEAQPQVIPSLGLWKPVIRKFVQGMNRLPWL